MVHVPVYWAPEPDGLFYDSGMKLEDDDEVPDDEVDEVPSDIFDAVSPPPEAAAATAEDGELDLPRAYPGWSYQIKGRTARDFRSFPTLAAFLLSVRRRAKRGLLFPRNKGHYAFCGPASTITRVSAPPPPAKVATSARTVSSAFSLVMEDEGAAEEFPSTSMRLNRNKRSQYPRFPTTEAAIGTKSLVASGPFLNDCFHVTRAGMLAAVADVASAITHCLLFDLQATDSSLCTESDALCAEFDCRLGELVHLYEGNSGGVDKCHRFDLGDVTKHIRYWVKISAMRLAS